MKTLIWDFDGTLVKFTSWRGAVMDALDEGETGHGIDPEQIRPFLRDGFPWHRPDEPHPHLGAPHDWWKALEPVFVRAYEGVGFNRERAGELASQVRRHMIRPERYILYDDTLTVLAALQEKGWHQVILSNHMPELPDVVQGLGLAAYIERCITSAATGYEKPNPQAFKIALAEAGSPEFVWMVGDNAVSDITGAEAIGIPAILVHAPPVEGIKYQASCLFEAMRILENAD